MSEERDTRKETRIVEKHSKSGCFAPVRDARSFGDVKPTDPSSEAGDSTRKNVSIPRSRSINRKK
jgi:hypothetical protein